MWIDNTFILIYKSRLYEIWVSLLSKLYNESMVVSMAFIENIFRKPQMAIHWILRFRLQFDWLLQKTFDHDFDLFTFPSTTYLNVNLCNAAMNGFLLPSTQLVEILICRNGCYRYNIVRLWYVHLKLCLIHFWLYIRIICN